MEVIVAGEELREAVAAVAPFGGKLLPVLDSINLVANRDGLLVRATNLDEDCSVWLPAIVDKPGGICVPRAWLKSVAKSLNGDDVSLVAKGKEFTFQSRSPRNTDGGGVDGFLPTEFPVPIADFEPKHKIELLARDLKQLFEATHFAVSDEESRPVLNGLCWRVNPKTMTMAATDGHVLSLFTLPSYEIAETFECILPTATIAKVVKNFQSSTEIEILLNSRFILFKAGNKQIHARLIEGPYPEYTKVIPPKHDTEVLMDVEDWLDAVKQVAPFGFKPDWRVTHVFHDDMVTLTVKTAEEKAVTRGVEPLLYEGPAWFTIDFNAQLLMKMLKNIEGDQVLVELDAANKPIVLSPVTDKGIEPDQLCLLMPLRRDY